MSNLVWDMAILIALFVMNIRTILVPAHFQAVWKPLFIC